MGKQKTHEQFLQEVFSIVGDDYIVLSEYKNSKEKVLLKHNNKDCDNNEFYMTPSSFFRGRRCPLCKKRESPSGFKKTQEDFEKDVFKIVGEEYLVLGKYKNSETKILMKHNIEECMEEFEIRPNNFISKGNRCPKCSIAKRTKNRTMTHEQYIKKIKDIYGEEYSILGKYVKNDINILTRHNSEECNFHEWYANPNNFSRKKTKCPICSEKERIKKRTKSLEVFIKEVYDLVKNEYMILDTENYKNSKSKVKMKHNSENCDFYEWYIESSSFFKWNKMS